MQEKDKNSGTCGTLGKRAFLNRRQAGKVDNFLIKLAVFSVGILFLSQGFLFKAETRQFFSMVDRLEGEQIPSAANLYAEYAPEPLDEGGGNAFSQMSKLAGKTLSSLRSGETLVIRIIEPRKSKDALILVNGKPQSDLSQGSAAVIVYEGDYVEIDSTRLKQPSKFVVNTLNQDKVITPIDGMFVEGSASLLTIGKVKLK